MKRTFDVLTVAGLMLLLSINAFTVYATEDNSKSEEYIMGDISTLPVDFYLNIDVVATRGNEYENATNTVDSVCTFQIRKADGKAASSLYDISLFQDSSFLRMFPASALPFTLKQNYKGMKDGDYRITFVAKDESGKTGKGSATIRVRH